MSRTLQETIDIAVERSGAPDAEARAEALLELAVSEACDYYASDDARAGVLTETKDVGLADGSATLDADVCLARANQFRLYDPAAPAKRYVYLKGWDDFAGAGKDARCGYWTVKGGTLYSIEPAAAYEEGAGATLSMKLTCLTSPEVPATADAEWDEPDEVVETIVDFLAEMLMPPRPAAPARQ